MARMREAISLALCAIWRSRDFALDVVRVNEPTTRDIHIHSRVIAPAVTHSHTLSLWFTILNEGFSILILLYGPIRP